MSQDDALRPLTFDEYRGQDHIMPMIKTMVKAALKRGDAVGHLLFSGPPGLGKTTVAQVIANEIDSRLHFVNAPSIDGASGIRTLLSKVSEHDVLFIDETHRLNVRVAEILYPAMEDFTMELNVGDESNMQTMQLPLPKFTLIGATTHSGLVPRPMRTRFQHIAQMKYYSVKELKQIVSTSATKLELELTPCGAEAIAKRARGTPRTANKHVLTLRDHATVYEPEILDSAYVSDVLSKMGIDSKGLADIDRTYLNTLIETFRGEPTGVKTLASVLGEQEQTLEESVEPYLLTLGFIRKTSRGRLATDAALEHMEVAQ